MTNRFFAAIAAVLLITALPRAETAGTAGDAPADDALELYFFGSSTCGECLEIKNTLLYPLEQELGGRMRLHYHDTENSASFELMIRMERQYGVTEGSPQELFFPDTVLLGYTAIMANARAIVEEYLNDPQGKMKINVSEPAGDVNAALWERFKSFTIGAIVVAALIDSVNPCAIATMIFLVSFLATQKRKRSEVLATGLSFTFAVFLTYLLLGVGAFQMITMLDQYFWVSRAIKWTAVVLAGAVGVISLIDGLRFKKSGDTKDIKLQLPKAVKVRIHKIITENMKGRRLLIGAFTAGFLVTLLEAICTGQVYLPTIVLMTRASGDGTMQVVGWVYLIMYCIIFVLPLLAVMIAAYHGMKWNKLAKITQNNLTLLKILLGIIMIGLAFYLAMA
jgi:cytochrome c biogenesis protein CcdA